ncbi:MAG: MurR/RpiR family transcriptional regulator [Pseudolabrys sp.]|nr:MurR/RpiR family transcriptional regulator [Pseudolabrys sp.]
MAKLRGLRDSLGGAGLRIADMILRKPSDVIHMTITEVAERSKASEGSVIGLCKQLGASGFQQLKIVLAQELVQPVQFIHEDLEEGDSSATVIGKIFSSNIQTLRDTLTVLDSDALEKAVDIIRNADRVELYGVGSAAPIVEDAHYRMLRIGLDARVVVDSHVQAICASLTGPKVAVLTVSHSGSSHETVMATKLAKNAGARTICITNFGKSPIQAFSDVVLFTMARETYFRTEAMTSRIAQLAIIDALIACLALSDYDNAIEALKHTFDTLSLKRY